MNRFLSVCVGLLALAASAPADMTLGFGNITGNSAANAASGQSQLFVDVVDLGGNQVRFNFRNVGPDAMSITDVYFDDGTLLGIAQIFNGAGVAYSQFASPGDLPGGNNLNPAFETTAGFSADSSPPVQFNGVNPGETLGIVFNLQSGGTYADVISELGTGELRVGIHVQAFANGGSESFINQQIPLPGAVMLGLLGLGFVSRARRKF